MREGKIKAIIDMASKAVERPKITCPGCNAALVIDVAAQFKEHSMTLQYHLNAGHKMGVEEFADSIKALARALKTIARDLGTKVIVVIDKLEIADNMVGITVLVLHARPITEAK